MSPTKHKYRSWLQCLAVIASLAATAKLGLMGAGLHSQLHDSTESTRLAEAQVTAQDAGTAQLWQLRCALAEDATARRHELIPPDSFTGMETQLESEFQGHGAEGVSVSPGSIPWQETLNIELVAGHATLLKCLRAMEHRPGHELLLLRLDVTPREGTTDTLLVRMVVAAYALPAEQQRERIGTGAAAEGPGAMRNPFRNGMK